MWLTSECEEEDRPFVISLIFTTFRLLVIIFYNWNFVDVSRMWERGDIRTLFSLQRAGCGECKDSEDTKGRGTVSALPSSLRLAPTLYTFRIHRQT